MSRLTLIFTKDFDKTKEEVESRGGRIIHRLGSSSAVISLPKPNKISDLEMSSTKMPDSLEEQEKMIVKAWKATRANKRTEDLSLMRRSTREGIKWDASSFTAPAHNDPAAGTETADTAAKSTGIPTSLYMAGSVAVGVIIVSGDPWHKISGKLKHASVASDGTVWGVNSSDNIYRYQGSNKWQKISGKLKQISVGNANTIWGVNSSDNIYRYQGNNQWQKIPGKLKHVSVASDGTVWGVNSSDNIYRYQGNNEWQKISGKLKQISVGNANTIWGVNSSDNIYRYQGNNKWQKISGKLKCVSVASDGSVFGVNSNNDIFRYLGNNTWQNMPGKLVQISAGRIDNLWGVNSIENIYSGSSASGLDISQPERQKIIQEVQEGLNFLATANLSANVSFHYDFHFISVNVTPGPDPAVSGDYARFEDPWRNAAMKEMGYKENYTGVVDYVQALKAKLKTDWAYAAFFTQYPLNHFAYAGGVRLVMDYSNDGWGPDSINRVFAHETCHIFGAADEYGSCSCNASGYYNIANNNCKNCTSSQLDCLMDANTLAFCNWTYGQIGWSFWEQVSGKLKHVSVASDGTVWGVNSSDNIYRYQGNNKWQKISGKLKQISVGNASTIWGVNSSDNIYRYQGNNKWQKISGKLKHVSVASDGTVWGVNSSDNIYRYQGNNKWQKISGKLKQISVGNANTIWGVNSSDNIYHYQGNSKWQRISGKLKHVSVARDGTVWGVNSSDNIYRYQGNNRWQRMGGALKQISVSDPREIWGVNSTDNIYKRNVLATP